MRRDRNSTNNPGRSVVKRWWAAKKPERANAMSGVRIQSFLLALAAFSTVGVGGEETFRESVKHYDISGSTARELREALDRLGPGRPDGERYDGYTNDLKRRTAEHTKTGLSELVYYEGYKAEADARRRERQMKHHAQALTALKSRMKESLE